MLLATITKYVIAGLCITIVSSCQDTDKKINYTSMSGVNMHEQIYTDIKFMHDANTLISLLNTNSDLEGPTLGFKGEPSVSYAYFNQLVKIADDSTLLRLTFHENPKIRVYGMTGLSIKNPKLAEAQLDRFHSDSAAITKHNGCIIMTLPIYCFATSEMDSIVKAEHESKMFLKNYKHLKAY